MEKINLNNLGNCVRCVCVSSLILTAFPLEADTHCQCYFCLDYHKEDNVIDYSSLGEYEDAFREFEMRADQEEGCTSKGFFLKKWCKKLKKWFKKTVVKILKKMINFKKFKSKEHCAYEAAHFKRAIDKKLHNTGSIEDFLEEFCWNVDDPAYSGMEEFANRIRYYYNNKNEKPPRHPEHDRYNFCTDCAVKSDDGDNAFKEGDIPIRSLVGGVEAFCGFLIQAIPFPGCFWFGRFLIGHGFAQVYEGFMVRYEEDKRNPEPPVPKSLYFGYTD